MPCSRCKRLSLFCAPPPTVQRGRPSHHARLAQVRTNQPPQGGFAFGWGEQQRGSCEASTASALTQAATFDAPYPAKGACGLPFTVYGPAGCLQQCGPSGTYDLCGATGKEPCPNGLGGGWQLCFA